MESARFQKLADECLVRVARWLEGFDPDELDYSTSDGVVTLAFSDGKRFVLNRQGAASQMWFAADARAWHFGWDEARASWIGDKDGRDLYERIGECVSERLRRSVKP